VGIAGYYRLPVAPEKRRGLPERMIGTLAHWAPMAAAITSTQTGLAHARLSIIDVAAGQQPMCNEDGTVWTPSTAKSFNYWSCAPISSSRHTFRRAATPRLSFIS
jgi:asparagine synthase (glutamine-hydrolysing)